jgi:hypothetical protein
MSRNDEVIEACEAWNPDQESSENLAARLGISKARCTRSSTKRVLRQRREGLMARRSQKESRSHVAGTTQIRLTR